MSDAVRRPAFRVSQAAIDELSAAGGRVRVDLVEGGCSGRTWTFTQDAPRAGDEVFGCEGAVLAVSPDALSLLAEARLD